jgi:D-methionine transport system substrate-binding protein
MSTPIAVRRLIIILALFTVLASACGLGAAGASQAAPGNDTVIRLIASDAPYTVETIAVLSDLVKKQGFELRHVVINDIVQPNLMTEDGSADVNFFQHEVYMKQFNLDRGTHIVPAFYTTFSPAGLFSKKYKTLQTLPDGAKVGLPVDPANNGRALVMLQENGLLTVKAGIDVTKLSTRDVTANPHHYQFIEVDQQMLLRTLEDVDVGFLFGATANQNGLTLANDALAVEQAKSSPYKGIIGTRPALVGTPKIEALRKAFQSDEVKQLYLKRFAKDPGAVAFLW